MGIIYIEPHRICNGQHARIEFYRSCVRTPVDVKQKTTGMKFEDYILCNSMSLQE